MPDPTGHGGSGPGRYLPVPATFDDLTVDWVAAALDAADGLLAIDVEPLGPGVGFLGDVARVGLTWNDRVDRPAIGAADRADRPATVIVKLPPADPGGRHVGAMLNVWAREHAFYTEVAPRSPGAQVPICHHAGADAERGRWVLVLEDCPSDPLDPGTGATRAQAEAAVDALATFHARWWDGHPEAGGHPDRPFGWMPGFDRTGVGGLQGPWRASTPRFLERYGHLLPPGTDGWLRAFAEELPAWSARAGTEPLTIVHADYRLDNLRYHAGRITMLDWQTALRGPGAMDLSSFVVTACTIEDRRAWEPDLLERYADGLRRGGVELRIGSGDQPALHWLARSYDENLLWWMGQFANNLAHLEPDDPGAQAALDTMIERTYTAAADREVGRLLP